MTDIKTGYALCKILGIDPSLVINISIEADMGKSIVFLKRLLSNEEKQRLMEAMDKMEP